jgi:hypothetical protein
MFSVMPVLTTRSVRMRLLHGEVRFWSPLASAIFLAPPVLVHMHLIAQRICPMLLGVPCSSRSFLRPVLNSLEVATSVHDTSGRHVRTILGIPFIWDGCYVYGTHKALAHLVDAMVNMYGVDIRRFWLTVVRGVPVYLLTHFILRQSRLVRSLRHLSK